MSGKTWEVTEITLLRDNYDIGIDKLKILFPNRSVKSIRNKLNDIGLDIYKKHAYYSKEEDLILVNNHFKEKEILLNLLPNRTWESIRKRIDYLGLEREKGWKFWSEPEVNILLESRTLQDAVSKIKTRSYTEIQGKARLIGKRFIDDRIWLDEEIDILKKLYPNYNIKIVQEKLKNRSLQSIYAKANKLKLSSHRNRLSTYREQIINLFVQEDMMIKDIAFHFNTTRQSVSKIIPKNLRERNIKTNKDEFLRLYLQGYSSGHISRKFNVSSSYVIKFLHKNHIDLRNSKDYIKVNLPIDEIISLYDSGISATKIAEKYNTTNVTIIKRLKKENIKIYSTNQRYISREKSHFWKGGISSENVLARSSLEYKQWRFNVFKRDNFMCQCCFNSKSSKLHAHHILNFSTHKDERFSVDNGITLCKICHDPTIKGSFHNIYGTRNNTYEQLYEYMTSSISC